MAIHRQLMSALVLASMALACVPDVEVDEWRVDRPRLLAVRTEPAEAAPSAKVRFEALVADPSGEARTVDWSFCTLAKPLSESSPVHRACLERAAEAITPFGAGLSVEGTLPVDGCRLFGPTPPVPKPGEPAARAVDPDATGGYQQPVLVDSTDAMTPELSAIARVRIRCGLVGATQAQSAEWTRRSTTNANPRITALTANGTIVEGNAFTVAPGAAVELSLAWPACPRTAACGDGICSDDEDRVACSADCETPRACEGAESYVLFDRETRTLVRRRESVRVSWYASAGQLEEPRTGVAEDAPDQSFSSNRWTAPTSGPATLWAVVRDDRGGVSWSSWTVEVGP